MTAKTAGMVRHIGFVVLNSALTCGATWMIARSIPAFSPSEAAAFLAPMAVASVIGFGLLFPKLRSSAPGASRFAKLYLALLGIVVAVAVYVAIFLSGGPSGDPTERLRAFATVVALIVAVVHVSGGAFLLGIAAVNKLLSPVFFPRNAAA